MALVAINSTATATTAMILFRGADIFAVGFVAAICVLALERLASFFLATCGASIDESCCLILFLDIVPPYRGRHIPAKRKYSQRAAIGCERRLAYRLHISVRMSLLIRWSRRQEYRTCFETIFPLRTTNQPLARGASIFASGNALSLSCGKSPTTRLFDSPDGVT